MEEAIGHLYKARKTGFSSKATLEVNDFIRRLLEDDSDLLLHIMEDLVGRCKVVVL